MQRILAEAAGVDWGVLWNHIVPMLVAGIMGPLFNVAVNLPVLRSRTGVKIDLDKEFQIAGAAQCVTTIGLGFGSYLSVSNTLEHRANGGQKRASTMICVFAYALFLFVHPLHGIFQIIPFPMLGGVYFWMGIDELWNDLGPSTFVRLPLIDYCQIIFMLCIFIATGLNLLYPLGFGVLFSILNLSFQNVKASPFLSLDTSETLQSRTHRSSSDMAELLCARRTSACVVIGV